MGSDLFVLCMKILVFVVAVCAFVLKLIFSWSHDVYPLQPKYSMSYKIELIKSSLKAHTFIEASKLNQYK